ncbi:DUF2489 domain-containing protein [Glaciecola sp. 1036]|uniref:DUF2489 domain-containing protein n=1 Tax=Alteromonadaceae TaxID=72275 RepID=UPI003CFC7AC2
MLQWILVGLGALIILGLGIYAGRLLFLLKAQNDRQQAARNKRIETITKSIQTIAFAMEQQQCDPSEGAIRICNLLEALPLDPQPDFVQKYPAMFALYADIQHFPTHEARQALSKAERRQQDTQREQIESDYESKIQPELVELKQFDTSKL